jgi:hypothetical protein
LYRSPIAELLCQRASFHDAGFLKKLINSHLRNRAD